MGLEHFTQVPGHDLFGDHFDDAAQWRVHRFERRRALFIGGQFEVLVDDFPVDFTIKASSSWIWPGP
jgi:hypothetical protein